MTCEPISQRSCSAEAPTATRVGKFTRAILSEKTGSPRKAHHSWPRRPLKKKKKNEYPRVPYVNVNRRDTFGNTNLQRHFSSARRGRRDREKIVEIKGQAFFIARFRSVCEKTDSKFYFIVVLINF